MRCAASWCAPQHPNRATAALAAALATTTTTTARRRRRPYYYYYYHHHRVAAIDDDDQQRSAVFFGEEQKDSGDASKEEETKVTRRKRRTTPPTKRDRALKNAAARGITTTAAAAARPDGRFRETSVDKAKSQALRFLAAKPRTKKELEIKLVEDKGYDIEDAREALEAIEQLGLHSDKLYSEQWARMKWRQSRWNKWKVASELKKRGVNEDDIEDGLWKVYADWERSLREELLNVCRDYEDACTGSGDHGNNNNALRFTHESDVDVSGAEDDEGAVVGKRASELFASARKQWVSGSSTRYLNDDSEAKTRRLFAWLQRRGFDHTVAKIVAETLKDEDQREKWRREEEEEDCARE